MEAYYKLSRSTREQYLFDRIKDYALAGILHVPAIALVLFLQEVRTLTDSTKWAITLGLVLNTLFRIAHWISIQNSKSQFSKFGRTYWLSLYRLSTVFSGLCWTAMAVYCFLYFGLKFPTLMVTIEVAAVSGSAIVLFSMDLFLFIAFQAILWIPLIAIMALQSEIHSDIPYIALCLATFALFTTVVGIRFHRWYWKSILQREAVSHHRDELASVLNAFPGFVFWLDMSLNYLGVNEQMSQSFGVKAESFVGKPIGFMRAGEPLISTARSFAESPKIEEIHELPIYVKGVETWSHVVLRKFIDLESSRILVIVLDIQDRKNAEDQLKVAQIQNAQNERLSLLGAMAGGIAHEINNPLAIIQGRLEQVLDMIEDDPIDRTSIQNYLTKGLSTVERMARIVRGLKLMARGEQSDSFEVTNVRTIIDDAVELCKSQAETHGIRLTLGENSEALTALCNATQISQVVLNLIQNAIDELKNRPNPWISVTVTQTGNKTEIRVTDSGQGISKDIADKLFVPFFTTKPAGQGSGLGLSISKAIVERHGGSLSLDSETSNTSFVLVLPRQKEQINSPPAQSSAA